ncbi:MAG: acyl-CoA dehydrogenase family protein [Halobacteriovoraceae bacterium]|nr:acyl-CoA dehydrogenase family protein [Halobacteriovoraceae bacterium]
MNELQKTLIDQINKYCQTSILPTLEQDEEQSFFRSEVYIGFGELGLTGIPLPSTFGGSELSYLDFCYTLETIAKYSVSYAVTLSVSTMVASIINQYGNDDQKETYLPDLISGKSIGAFALTESGSGSDAAALQTTAKKTTDGYILNGSKMFITSAGIAKTYIVMARTSVDGSKGISAFIVKENTPGFTIGKKEKKMGWKVSPTCELIFQNCFIPEENLLCKQGDGLKIALSALVRGRITIGAIAVGLSQVALDKAVLYSLERKQFSQQIFEFQGIQFMLSDMATETECSRLLVHEAAKQYDSGNLRQKFAAMAKAKATDVCMNVTTDAVQIFGGVGYTSEYPVERFMRDAKVLQIVEGTNQIQRVIISRELKKEYS